MPQGGHKVFSGQLQVALFVMLKLVYMSMCGKEALEGKPLLSEKECLRPIKMPFYANMTVGVANYLAIIKGVCESKKVGNHCEQ